MRTKKITSILYILFFTGIGTIVSSQQAITVVTVTGSQFCAGQSLTVSYTTTGGQFGNNNVFTAQLSDSLGSFSAPVAIGSVTSRRSGNISAIVPPDTPEGTHYRIMVTSSNPVLTSNPNGSDLIIHVQPAPPDQVTATPSAICAGSSSILNAISAGNTIGWYTAATGGSILGTSESGADFTVTPLATTTYYAESLNASGCSGSARTMVTVTVTPIPVITTTTPGRVCNSGQVTLGAVSSAGTVNWYSDATGGQVLGTGVSFITPVITETTTYYADATANGCTTGSRSSVTATVNSIPSAPVPGVITQPTCPLPTGSVVLNNLPATGTWTLTRTPGGSTSTGTGTSKTITGLASGSYTYTVTDGSGCTSPSSSDIVINIVPASPSPPAAGAITQPTCALPTGSVVLNNLPATGTWTLTRTPGGSTSTGTGPSMTITGLASGTYTYTVTDSSGCTSSSSSDIVINTVPASPSRPAAGAITQPTCTLPTGSVVLNNLPATGTWTLTRTPGGSTSTGTGTSITITGLAAGTYTYTVTDSSGCTSSSSSDIVINTVPASPSRPTVGVITQPTCVLQTGSVVLNNLPASGTWTLTRTPGGSTSTGTGTSMTITGLASGTYTYTVTNASGCTSPSSSNIVINTVPASPTPPAIGVITQPICALPTGSVVLNNLPATGTWTLTRTPGGSTSTGTGTSMTITGLASGTYTYTVTNASGCTSLSSSNIVINTVPASPSPPAIGAITQPICALPTGSVVLNNLPATGTWTLTRTPGGSTSTGTGTSMTITGLASGTYTYTVTNASGCTSLSSSNIVINTVPASSTPPAIGAITQPICALPTGSVVLNNLPATGTWTLTRTPGGSTSTGTGTSMTITGLASGTYTYTVTNASGCTSLSSSNIVINSVPASPSPPIAGVITQPTCVLQTGSVVLNNLPASGTWTLTRTPGGSTSTGTGTSMTITGLASGTYTYTVTNSSGCTSSSSSNIVINAIAGIPGAPVPGSVTQPTCALATGSVVLNGLPATGIWTITRTPGGVAATGTGTTTTISGIVSGSYTFYVTTAAGCSSAPSSNVTINPQPQSPGTPVYRLDCTLGFGHAVITISSPIGTGLQYSLNAGSYQSSPVFAAVANGNYFLTVRNIEGCTTPGSIFEVLCGCVNPPVVTMGAINGMTCGSTPVTVTGNTFSGNTSAVTITEDGAGSVNPTSSGTSPFSFTYTPAAGDAGRTVVITVTSNNPLGPPCTIASGTYTLTVNAVPSAPSVGTVTSLTCSGESGSVMLSGLPADGPWTLNRHPDNVSETGTGTTFAVTGLPAGTFTFTVTTQAGCTSPESSNAVIQPQPPSPPPPVTGTITHPTCAVSTGSVILSGLPSSGSWILTQNPGGATRSGNGATTTISLLPGGTYTFTVTNSFGCSSSQSENVVIHEQPVTPLPPAVTSIVKPTCTVVTGSVNLSGLPSSGTWTLTRYPGTIATTGTGTITTVSGLTSGTYNFTVANAAGCISLPSADVIIPAQPPLPDIPVIGTIIQPTLTVQTGSVTLNRLPSDGSWTITRLPDGAKSTGTGTSYTITGVKEGKYKFTITNSFGCTSAATTEVVIASPVSPVLIITNPEPVCSPATVNITSSEITAGSPAGLVYTYWKDSEATVPYSTPATATDGTYYIKGTSSSGFYDIEPVTVTVEQIPFSNPGPDQVLEYKFTATLNAVLNLNETGIWSVDTGNAVFSDVNDPFAEVSDLDEGKNVLVWIVSNGICPSNKGRVTITVRGLTIPTLITPNGDSKNEYLIINGIENLGKTDLIIFDRRGKEVFRNSDYDNKWNGVDYNGNPLSDDTYFYVLKSASGKSRSGYIMIRR